MDGRPRRVLGGAAADEEAFAKVNGRKARRPATPERATLGQRTEVGSMATELRRPSQGQGRVIAGVCAAIADRFGISRTLVRVGFVVFGLMGAGVFAYIVLWVLIPTADQ
jgi:phage shock protein C